MREKEWACLYYGVPGMTPKRDRLCLRLSAVDWHRLLRLDVVTRCFVLRFTALPSHCYDYVVYSANPPVSESLGAE